MYDNLQYQSLGLSVFVSGQFSPRPPAPPYFFKSRSSDFRARPLPGLHSIFRSRSAHMLTIGFLHGQVRPPLVTWWVCVNCAMLIWKNRLNGIGNLRLISAYFTYAIIQCLIRSDGLMASPGMDSVKCLLLEFSLFLHYWDDCKYSMLLLWISRGEVL